MAHWRRTLVVLWLMEFFCIAGLSLAMPFLPLYIQQLGVTEPGRAAFLGGISIGVTFLMMGLLQPVWGSLADRYGRKTMLMRAVLGSAACLAALAFVHNIWQLIALRMAHGIFGGFVTAASALMACVAPAESMGFALGTLQTALVSGAVLGPAVGGLIVGYIGYQNLFLLTGGTVLLGGILVFIFVKESPSDYSGANPIVSPLENLKLISRSPQLSGVLWVHVLAQIALIAPQPVIATFVAELTGHPGDPVNRTVTTMTGLVFSAAGVTTLLAAPLWGRAGDRVGHQKILGSCILGSCIAYIPQAFSSTAAHLMYMRGALGAFMGGMSPSTQSIIARSTPLERRGGMLGVAAGLTLIGTAIGPVMGGFIADYFGVRPVFLATAAILLVAWLVFLRLPRIDAQTDVSGPGVPEETEG